MRTHTCRHTHTCTPWHHMVLPIDLWNIKLLKCYVLILGLRLICLTSNENYYHTQRSVLTPGLILSPVLHVYCHLDVINSLKTFSLEGLLLIPREAVKYGSASVLSATLLKHMRLAWWITTLDLCQTLRWPQHCCDVLALWESGKENLLNPRGGRQQLHWIV